MPDQVNTDVYKQEWQYKEGPYTVTRTAHWSGPGCHDSCGVLLYTDDEGKLVKVEGDPSSPYNNGRLCMRCLNMPEAVNHPDRLKYPMRRVGERGENKWERITWDEAYDEIEAQVRSIWEDYGPESIVAMEGTGRNAIWQVPYLCHAGFKSPNFSARLPLGLCLLSAAFGCGSRAKRRAADPRCLADEPAALRQSRLRAS